MTSVKQIENFVQQLIFHVLCECDGFRDGYRNCEHDYKNFNDMMKNIKSKLLNAFELCHPYESIDGNPFDEIEEMDEDSDYVYAVYCVIRAIPISDHFCSDTQDDLPRYIDEFFRALKFK